MGIELEGTQDDLNRLNGELTRRFPELEFRIEPSSTGPFADRPLGETALLTAILVFVGAKVPAPAPGSPSRASHQRVPAQAPGTLSIPTPPDTSRFHHDLLPRLAQHCT